MSRFQCVILCGVVLGFAACSDDDDPSDNVMLTSGTPTGSSTGPAPTNVTPTTGNNATTGNSTGQTGGTQSSTNNTTGSSTTGNGSTQSSTTGTNSTQSSTNNTSSTGSSTTGTTTPTTGGDPNAECNFTTNFTGQVDPARRFGGGVFVTGKSSFAPDSGIAALQAQIKMAVEMDLITETSQEYTLPTPVVIDGATIVSTNFLDMASMLPRMVYLEDQQDGIPLFFGDPSMIPFAAGSQFSDADASGSADVVGTRVRVVVTAVQVFDFITPQISGISQLEVLGTNADVGVREATGTDIGLDDYQRMVRVRGRIGQAPARTCGMNIVCLDLFHGSQPDVKHVELRVNTAAAPMPGDCAAFVGPVSAFPGPFGATAAPSTIPGSRGPFSPQLNASNFSWLLKFTP